MRIPLLNSDTTGVWEIQGSCLVDVRHLSSSAVSMILTADALSASDSAEADYNYQPSITSEPIIGLTSALEQIKDALAKYIQQHVMHNFIIQHTTVFDIILSKVQQRKHDHMTMNECY